MALFSKTMRKHIFVHPAQQNKLHTAVKATLLKDKKKFSDKLEGALMDVANLRVVGEHHLIVDGYLSMDVEGDFQVFRPTVGMLLEGVVNKISRGHVGCLVMDLFNASLTISPNSLVSLNVGDNCEFTVTDVIIDGDILSLRGSLFSGSLGVGKDQTARDEFELEKKKKSSDSKSVKFNDENSSNDDLYAKGVLTQMDPSPKAKTKKSPKKVKVKVEPNDELEDGMANTLTSFEEEISRHETKSPKKSKNVATSIFTSVKQEVLSPTKSHHKSKRKSSESRDTDGIFIKEEAISPFKDEYSSPEKSTSQSKKAKKNKKEII